MTTTGKWESTRGLTGHMTPAASSESMFSAVMRDLASSMQPVQARAAAMNARPAHCGPQPPWPEKAGLPASGVVR
jgi:hypothetical protein